MLLEILARIQAAQKLYQVEEDYQPHQLEVEEQQAELLDLLCPPDDDAVLDLAALLAQPSSAQATAGALAETAQAAWKEWGAARAACQDIALSNPKSESELEVERIAHERVLDAGAALEKLAYTVVPAFLVSVKAGEVTK